jgi:hypothetical protein
MKSKININKNLNHKFFSLKNNTINSTNSLVNPNKTIFNFISSVDLLNNGLKSEYKSSFVQTSIIKDKFPISIKIPQKLFTISNSRKKIPNKIKGSQNNDSEIKRRKFQVRLKKDIKLNLENSIINKNKIKDKIEPIKRTTKKIINKNTFFLEKKPSKNVSNCKYYDYNTTRASYTNNPISIYNNNSIKNKDIKKKKYQIKILIKKSLNNEKTFNIIKTDKNENGIINKIIHNKIKLNKNDEKNVIKKDSHNFEEINKKELKILSKKATFVQSDTSSRFNNYFNSKIKNSNKSNKKKDYFSSFINSYTKDIKKYLINKKKINIRNHNQEYYTISNSNFSKNNTNLDLFKNIDFQIFNKNAIEEYNNKNANTNKKIQKNKTNIKGNEYNLKRVNLEEEEKNKKINVLKFKIIKNLKEKSNIFEKDREKDYDKNDGEDILDIETEHKNEINKIKANNYEINKPKEINLKYTLLKDPDYEEDNLNVNKSQIEKIVIGKIDGYKDIIESDELNRICKLRSKSSFDIHNKMNKLIKKEKADKNNDKNMKSFSNNKTSFVSMHILEDNSSEIEDLDFDNNNEQLLNIENEYEFENMNTYENEAKNINEINLLPFQESKISFCKYHDRNDRKFKTDGNMDKDILSLINIKKDINKMDDKRKNITKKSSHLGAANLKANKNSKTIKNVNKTKNTNKINEKAIEFNTKNKNNILNKFNEKGKHCALSKNDNNINNIKFIKTKIDKIINKKENIKKKPIEKNNNNYINKKSKCII